MARRAPGRPGELEEQGMGFEGEWAGLFARRALPLVVSNLYTFFESVWSAPLMPSSGFSPPLGASAQCPCPQSTFILSFCVLVQKGVLLTDWEACFSSWFEQDAELLLLLLLFNFERILNVPLRL